MTKGLDEILSGEAMPEQDTDTSTPETSEKEPQPRGEHGHFASKEPKEPEPSEEPKQEQQAPETPKPQGTVPIGALHAARAKERTADEQRAAAEERANRLERELAELRGSVNTLAQQRQQQTPTQPPPKPVDFWEDPSKWGESLLQPVSQELAQIRFETSLDRAVSKYGEDAVSAAETALKDAIERGELNSEVVKAQLSRSKSPMLDIVAWHQNTPAVREAALREQIRAELLAEQGGQQPEPRPVEQSSSPATVMPTNLLSQRNVGTTRTGPAWSGPSSLNDIFDRSRKKAS